MSADKLVFDLSQEIEGSPNVFVKKDWLNILDNMNQNYNSNQSVIDTSQLSNSNKWMSYREGYLLMPMILTLAQASSATDVFKPAGDGCDYTIGLKNWFGSIIHSFTLDYNGTTIIQQTPYINMWNTFKLLTSLSWGDVLTQGSTIGFYPDEPLAWGVNESILNDGYGVCNNQVSDTALDPVNASSYGAAANTYEYGKGNVACVRRLQYINFDAQGTPDPAGLASYGSLLNGTTSGAGGNSACNLIWRSYVYNKVDSGVGTPGILQIAITATIYLKHIHSFFAMCPLLKGTFMKMTMNLNNTTVGFTTTAGASTATAEYGGLSVSNAVGGVCPIMLSSLKYGSENLVGGTAGDVATYYANLSVGATCLSSTISNLAGYQGAPLARSVYLYVPAYTFNPVFEASYMSSTAKQIKYTDVYQYQVQNVASGSYFNNLLTNGISNIKSVLIIPFYSASDGSTGGIGNSTGLPTGIPVYQSPFDPAGCGATSPLCPLTNFNIVVSGQNSIYNTERYSFEQFNNQFYGKNAVNGGMTDGLTSGLIDRLGFDMEYCYYYVDVSRMLPVEEAVPKSVQIVGQNLSARNLDLWCFIEYGVDISIDVYSGARM